MSIFLKFNLKLNLPKKNWLQKILHKIRKDLFDLFELKFWSALAKWAYKLMCYCAFTGNCYALGMLIFDYLINLVQAKPSGLLNFFFVYFYFFWCGICKTSDHESARKRPRLTRVINYFVCVHTRFFENFSANCFFYWLTWGKIKKKFYLIFKNFFLNS